MPLCGFNEKMLNGLTKFNEVKIERLIKMPMCGFDEKMLEGVNDFNEGLIEHGLVYRGKQNSETIDQGIKRELSDMARLKPELLRIDDVPKRLITQGIVDYAMGFYLVMRSKQLPQHIDNYKQLIQGVNQYFKQMDDKYYGELEGKPNDMRDLAIYLNKLDI